VTEGFRIEARGTGFDREEKGASGGMGGAGGAGGVPGVQTGRYSQSQSHHADQYGYFAGYPYAIINAIANRLAAQPIRVGRILPKGRKPDKGLRIKRAASSATNDNPTGLLCPKHLQEIANRVEIIPNHPINRALEYPNPIMVRHHLLYSTFASIEITGLGYWWMYRDKVTGKSQIWPIPSHWMEPVHEEERLFAYYKLTLPGTGQTIKVPTKQVAVFLTPDPSDPFGTYPVMQAMSKSVMTDWAFEVAQRMSLENGINPGLAIMVGKPPEFAGVGGDQMVLTAEQRNQIIAAVRRQYRGVTRFDEPLILDALIKDVKKITTSPVEMAFKDSGPLVRNRLCQGWGMNPITLGEIEGVNYASSGVADHHVCRTVFAPRCEVNSQSMTRYVGPYFGGNRLDDADVNGDLVVYQEPVQPSDPEMEMNRDWGDYDRGIISRNDIRRKRGLEPIKGGGFAFVNGSQAGGWVNVDGKDEDAPHPPITSDDGDGGDDHDHDPDTDDEDRDDDGGDDEDKTRPAGKKGRRRYRMVRGSIKLVDSSGHEHGADGKFGSGSGGSHADTAGGKRSDRHGTGALDSDPAKADKIAAGFMSKIKKAGKKAVRVANHVAEKVKVLAYQATWHAIRLNAAEEICDTSHDYAKIINAKNTGDWLSSHLGVSGGFAASVGSHVLSFAFTKLKQHLAKRRKEEGGKSLSGKPWARGRNAKADDAEYPTLEEAAKHIVEVLHGVLHPMGCPASELPSLAEVEKFLKKRHEDSQDDADGDGDEKRAQMKPGRPWWPMRWDRPRPKRGKKRLDPSNRPVVREVLPERRKAAETVDRLTKEAVEAVRENLLPVFEKLGQQAAARLRDVLNKGTAGRHPSSAEIAETVIDRAEWQDTLDKELRAALAGAVATGALTEWELFRAHALKKNRPVVTKSMPSRFWAAVRGVAQQVIDRGIVSTIVDNVVSGLRKAVKRARGEGKVGSDLADAAASAALVGAGADKSAKTVARNEGAAAVNRGHGAVRTELERTGRVEVTQWVCIDDTRTRDTHRRANGQTVRPGRAFSLGGFSCYYPGDLSLPPEERCNCRCKAITVYK
jgi:phage portal protein BeeE